MYSLPYSIEVVGGYGSPKASNHMHSWSASPNGGVWSPTDSYRLSPRKPPNGGDTSLSDFFPTVHTSSYMNALREEC